MPKGVANKRYTAEFKKQVVETMQKEKLSCCETASSLKKEVKSYDQTRTVYEPYPSIHRNSADQGHNRYPPLWKVGHVGADPAGTHGVQCQLDAV